MCCAVLGEKEFKDKVDEKKTELLRENESCDALEQEYIKVRFEIVFVILLKIGRNSMPFVRTRRDTRISPNRNKKSYRISRIANYRWNLKLMCKWKRCVSQLNEMYWWNESLDLIFLRCLQICRLKQHSLEEQTQYSTLNAVLMAKYSRSKEQLQACVDKKVLYRTTIDTVRNWQFCRPNRQQLSSRK
jgi:hypothetical protein